MKRILSLILVLSLMFCIAFQCSLESSAVVLADDAVLLILATSASLISFGISIQNATEFANSDLYKGLCREISLAFSHGVSRVKKGVEYYMAFNKDLWGTISAWIAANVVTGINNIGVEYTENVAPTSVTLTDGRSVPYADFMEFPCFIYETSTGLHAVYCTGTDPGMVWGNKLIEVYCVGTGQLARMDLSNNSSWTEAWITNMHTGYTYRGQSGSYYAIQFASNSGVNASLDSFYLYRTMERTNIQGDAVISPPANNIPETEVTTQGTVVMESDPVYYPGAVDAPVEVLNEGDQVLIKIPDEVLVDNGAGEFTFTSSSAIVEAAISAMSPANIKPVVLTNAASGSVTIEQVITNTPAQSITTTDSTAAADVEIANKFRLPKSFLEGFPFSIPYSIYVGIQSFVAEPQAPVFNFPFKIPALGLNEDITIDLNEWNAVARLCRALLSVVWVAGLAMVCSRFIKR